jgi:cytochrome P450
MSPDRARPDTVPRAPGLPLLGVALRFGPAWALETQRRLGDVFSLELPRKNGGVLVAHPDDVRAALIDKEGIVRPGFPEDPGNLLARATGDGIIARGGTRWVERRAMMQPSFRKKRLAAIVPLMRGAIDRHLDELDRRYARDHRAFDAHPEMHRLSLRVLVRSLFSTSAEARDIEIAGEAVDRMMQALSFDPLPLGKRRLLALAERGFDHIAERLVAVRRRTPPEDRPQDLLSAMLEMRDAAGAGLSDRQLRFELIGLLTGGKETSAITLSWLLALLTERPEVERKLVAELDEVLEGRAPEAEDLGRLRYMRMVLFETMRRYPPVWILFPRETYEEVRFGAHRVSKGTRIWVSPYVTHHHPSVWDRPEEFSPERFASEDDDDAPERRHPSAYLPFGGGPRMCIGHRFAMWEMQLAVARLLGRYRVRRAGRGAITPKVIFNTYMPRQVPIELLPRVST